MGQHIDLISKFNEFKGMFRLCVLMTLTFLNLSGGKVYGDSTYFPEDSDATDEIVDSTSEENSTAIKEWAELQPPKKKTVEVVPPKNVGKSEVSLAKPHPTKPEKDKLQKPTPISAEADKPNRGLAPEPQTTLVSDKHHLSSPPSEAAPEPLIAPAPAPTATIPSASPAAVAPQADASPTPSTTQTAPSLKEPQPLQLSTVEPRSKAIPVKDQTTEQKVTKKTVLSYADVANNRPPLGILEHSQEVHNQKWYIYSSAIRGLKNPSDKLQVVTMEGSPSNKGDEIKALLVDMGIEPEKIQLIDGTGEENQKGMTYIFAGS